MKLEGSIALVTGANRGLGAEFCHQLLGRGAAQIYGAARDPDPLRDGRVVPVRLDVTDRDSIKAAAETAADVTLLMTNAGIMTGATVLGDDELHENATKAVPLHVGFMDTDMTKDVDAPTVAPGDVAARALDGLEAGEQGVLADDTSRHLKAALAGPPSNLYPAVGCGRCRDGTMPAIGDHERRRPRAECDNATMTSV